MEFEYEEVDFLQELYEKNIKENVFAKLDELDGIGGEDNENN